MENTKDTIPSGHGRTDTDMNSQRLWQHAEDQARYGRIAERGSEHEYPSITQKPSLIDNHSQRKT